GQTREQPRMVGGTDGNLRYLPLLVGARLDQDLVAFLLHAPNQPRMTLERFAVPDEPVEGRYLLDIGIELLVRPAVEPAAEQRLRLLDTRRPLRCSRSRQVFVRLQVELAQQRPLPAVPDVGPDGTDVSHGQHQQ